MITHTQPSIQLCTLVVHNYVQSMCTQLHSTTDVQRIFTQINVTLSHVSCHYSSHVCHLIQEIDTRTFAVHVNRRCWAWRWLYSRCVHFVIQRVYTQLCTTLLYLHTHVHTSHS